MGRLAAWARSRRWWAVGRRRSCGGRPPVLPRYAGRCGGGPRRWPRPRTRVLPPRSGPGAGRWLGRRRRRGTTLRPDGIWRRAREVRACVSVGRFTTRTSVGHQLIVDGVSLYGANSDGVRLVMMILARLRRFCSVWLAGRSLLVDPIIRPCLPSYSRSFASEGGIGESIRY
jgi:hypothetical protein